MFFRGFGFPEYKQLFQGWIFVLFFELGLKNAAFHFREYKKSSLLRKYKNLFQSGIFRKKYKKFFRVKFKGSRPESTVFHFLKYKNSFSIRARKFDFVKYTEFFSGWTFFCFLGLALKVRQIAAKKKKKTPLKRCAK